MFASSRMQPATSSLPSIKSVGKIDGAVAVAMAIGRALKNEAGPTIYEQGRPEESCSCSAVVTARGPDFAFRHSAALLPTSAELGLEV